VTALRNRPGPEWASPAEAAKVLGVSRDAARKRFQRAGKLWKVRGRHWVLWRDVRAMLPGGELGCQVITTRQVAAAYGMTVQGARLRLQRKGAARKIGGRWLTHASLLAAACPEEFQAMAR